MNGIPFTLTHSAITFRSSLVYKTAINFSYIFYFATIILLVLIILQLIFLYFLGKQLYSLQVVMIFHFLFNILHLISYFYPYILLLWLKYPKLCSTMYSKVFVLFLFSFNGNASKSLPVNMMFPLGF